MTTVTALPSWQSLEQHFHTIAPLHMRELFSKDGKRAERYQAHAAGLLLDYSKNRINDQTLNLLCQLARDTQVEAQRDAMFQGTHINGTEDRAVLHTALRYRHDISPITPPLEITDEVNATLAKIKQFVDAVHSKERLGYQGDAFTDVVSIGIGGSFLGPKIISEALRPYWRDDLRCHFVANIDGSALSEKLAKLDPKRTLFVMSSKSFSTQETLTNTQSARDWFLQSGAPQSAIGQHFIAISSNIQAAEQFGIKAENVFPMWDWVGGRYSLWSAIGLPIALMVGFAHFEQLLAGAAHMDQHFCTAPLEHNMPVLMALISLWYINFFDASSHVILTYDHSLRGLPAYVQQLDMESNGKQVNHAGETLNYATGPVIWGGEGSNGQHAYHQLMHQGSGLIPADFILPLQSHNPLGRHHAMLASNCFAQAQALMQGKTQVEAEAELAKQGLSSEAIAALAPHKVMPGNKPSNTLLMDKLTPHTLGALVALYEHRTFVQGAVWGINSFDQWGVELGKVLGDAILSQLESCNEISASDSSTEQLIQRFRQGRIS